jgi:hypothetical protein
MSIRVMHRRIETTGFLKGHGHLSTLLLRIVTEKDDCTEDSPAILPSHQSNPTTYPVEDW